MSHPQRFRVPLPKWSVFILKTKNLDGRTDSQCAGRVLPVLLMGVHAAAQRVCLSIQCAVFLVGLAFRVHPP
eukprot:scaffold25948_cov117-Cylindrotheca_fusiformis.AAC.3